MRYAGIGHLKNRKTTFPVRGKDKRLFLFWSGTRFTQMQLIDNTNDLVLTCLRVFTLSPLDVVERFSRFPVPPLKVVLLMST